MANMETLFLPQDLVGMERLEQVVPRFEKPQLNPSYSGMTDTSFKNMSASPKCSRGSERKFTKSPSCTDSESSTESNQDAIINGPVVVDQNSVPKSGPRTCNNQNKPRKRGMNNHLTPAEKMAIEKEKNRAAATKSRHKKKEQRRIMEENASRQRDNARYWQERCEGAEAKLALSTPPGLPTGSPSMSGALPDQIGSPTLFIDPALTALTNVPVQTGMIGPNYQDPMMNSSWTQEPIPLQPGMIGTYYQYPVMNPSWSHQPHLFQQGQYPQVQRLQRPPMPNFSKVWPREPAFLQWIAIWGLPDED
jgi:hypothetical protein